MMVGRRAGVFFGTKKVHFQHLETEGGEHWEGEKHDELLGDDSYKRLGKLPARQHMVERKGVCLRF